MLFKKKIKKKESFTIRMINKILKLDHLKLFEFSLGLMKGFAIKVEFFQGRSINERSKK